MKIRTIITGATGMVGEGVLHECLNHPEVESVLVINRKLSGFNHPKLKEIILSDFFNVSALAGQLEGYNACYFCSGVSSVGMKEPEYTRLTYSLTMNFAETLASVSSYMTFCYVSGAGTDSTEKGRSMWARVKGKTENDLLKLPFKKVYNFRPGFMKPTPGLKKTLPLYIYLGWLYPLLHKLMPNMTGTLAELGLAMINVTRFDYDKQVLEVKDIVALSNKNRL